jgi:dihydrodipicolinate synthase/N-acetylneuraminate lyase
MKNDAGDFYENTAFLAQVRASGRRFEVITGGSMESFLHGRRFGQRAYAVALAMVAPHVALAFDDAMDDGDENTATRIVRDVEQPFGLAISPLGHWAALHEAIRQRGWFPSGAVRFPLATLDNGGAGTVEKALASLDQAWSEISPNTSTGSAMPLSV